jgi:hypothetical protein
MAVVEGIALHVADTVGVMTDGTRCLLVYNMTSVFCKTLVAQYAAPAMACITQCIVARIFLGKIRGDIVSYKNILVHGAVGALDYFGVIGIMTVNTGYNTVLC